MDQIGHIRSFVMVVETGGFSAAAERLNLGTSAVSQHVSALEESLATQLLVRSTRRVSLTEAGRVYFEYCTRILADLDEAREAIRSENSSLRGRLRIAAPLSFGQLHLVPVVADFLALHPDLEIDLDLNDRIVKIAEEGFDLAVRIDVPTDSSLMARRLSPMRRVTCASPDYLNRRGTPQHPTALSQLDGLAYTLTPRGTFWRYRLPDGEEISVDVPTRLRANNGDVLAAAAVAGLGITVLPTFLVHRHLARGELLSVLDNFALARELTIYAVYPPSRQLPQRVRKFIDFLVERFGDEPYWDQAVSVTPPGIKR